MCEHSHHQPCCACCHPSLAFALARSHSRVTLRKPPHITNQLPSCASNQFMSCRVFATGHARSPVRDLFFSLVLTAWTLGGTRNLSACTARSNKHSHTHTSTLTPRQGNYTFGCAPADYTVCGACFPRNASSALVCESQGDETGDMVCAVLSQNADGTAVRVALPLQLARRVSLPCLHSILHF